MSYIIPKNFKLAGIDFTVEIVKSIQNGAVYGEFNDALNRIQIAKSIKIEDTWYNVKPINRYQTFLHELFHVFSYYWNTEVPEDLAQVFANFMLEFKQTANYVNTLSN
jgi:hypothetical protein